MIYSDVFFFQALCGGGRPRSRHDKRKHLTRIPWSVFETFEVSLNLSLLASWNGKWVVGFGVNSFAENLSCKSKIAPLNKTEWHIKYVVCFRDAEDTAETQQTCWPVARRWAFFGGGSSLKRFQTASQITVPSLIFGALESVPLRLHKARMCQTTFEVQCRQSHIPVHLLPPPPHLKACDLYFRAAINLPVIRVCGAAGMWSV